MGQHLGQHFLSDKKILKEIAEATKDAPLIEIGPGHGELTELLLSKNPNRSLKAIERDPNLANAFRKKFVTNIFPNVSLVEGDARKELPRLLASSSNTEPPAVVGNIPYYLSGFLFRILGDAKIKPAFTIFTVQKEVAERAVAQTPHMNLLSASIQVWATPVILFEIPPEAFSPPPKVHSAVLQLTPHDPVLGFPPLSEVYKLIHFLFQHPRKKAISNLKSAYPDQKDAIVSFFSSQNFSENMRPQEFSIHNILLLAKTLNL